MRPIVGDVGKRNVTRFGFLIDQHAMALGKSPAPGILPRQPHRIAFLDEGAEGQRLGGGPVESLAGFEHPRLGLHLADHRLVGGKAVGNMGQRPADIEQGFPGNPGIAAPIALRRGREALPLAIEPIGLGRMMGLGRLEFLVEPRMEGVDHRAHVRLEDRAFVDQLFGIDVERGGMGVYRLVHQGLGERRLVGLVVAEAAIAEHVHHRVLVEHLAEFDGDARGVYHRLGIVAVDVDDRRLHDQGQIGAIGRRARMLRRGGEADLVVDDEMNGAAGAKAPGAAHGETFGDHALPRERRIAVQEKRQHGFAARGIAQLLLLGAHLAEYHRVGCLQMRGIGRERQMHMVAVEGAVGGGAEMIFDVARPLHVERIGAAALELVEDLAIGFGQHVGQHVEPAAMGHAEHDLAHPHLAAALDNLLQGRDHRFAAVEAEALGAEKPQGAELLEPLRFDQLGKNRFLAVESEMDVLVRPFDAALQPVLLFGVVDVEEFVADPAAIGFFEDFRHAPRGGARQAENAVEEYRPVEIGFGKTVRKRVQLRMGRFRRQLQRVEIGLEMADGAIGAHQLDGTHRIARRLARIGDGLGGRDAGQGAGQLVARDRAVGGTRPERRRTGWLAEAGEILRPARFDRRRIFKIAGVKRFDIDGIGAEQMRRFGEQGVGKTRCGRLTGHFPDSPRHRFNGETVSMQSIIIRLFIITPFSTSRLDETLSRTRLSHLCG